MNGKGRGQQRPASPQGISPRGYIFFLFYYYDWEIDDDFFTCFPSTVLDSARRLPFVFPFSLFFFFLFLFWGGISIIMIMIIITIVMAMAIYQSERKMENRSSSSSSKNVLTFCFCFCFCFLLLPFAPATGLQNTNTT